jgi:protein-arginine deiminase
MFRPRFLYLGVGTLALGAVACGSDGGGGGGGATGGTGGTTQPTNRIDIVVDANRDGAVTPDDPADQDLETEWTADVGASFIANLDDDDMNGVPDAEDEIISGDGDNADLAKFIANSWPTAPEGAYGIVRIDQESAESVRVYKYLLGGGSTLVMGGTGACNAPGNCTYILEHALSPEETKAGVMFGIEARRFKGQPMASLGEDDVKKNTWTGLVDLSYEIKGADGVNLTTEQNPDGFDRAKMRVAPWLMQGSLGAHDKLYSSSASPALVAGNEAAVAAAGNVEYTKIGTGIGQPGGWPDIWTEDFFQTGWTGYPGENGTVNFIRIYNARPWGRPPFNNPTQEQLYEYHPMRWLNGNPEKGRPPTILGPGSGGTMFYNAIHHYKGHTQDSHGNHDLIPPYEGYPNGRIFHGSKTYAETAEFYNQQGVQGPAVVVDTSWLAVEHVDEFFHFVPAGTPRGWKLLTADIPLMTSMLEEMQTAGNGSAVIHAGKGGFFEMTIDEALTQPDLATWQQQSWVKVQGHIDTLKTETGLTDDEIVGIPTWFEDLASNEKVAWNPGMVNMRMLGNVADIPKPFGPIIGGTDPFETYVKDELGTAKNALGSEGQGLNVFFTDDWYYHEALGEVHCATNESAPTEVPAWWESGK